jgi:hypothetical protein
MSADPKAQVKQFLKEGKGMLHKVFK